MIHAKVTKSWVITIMSILPALLMPFVNDILPFGMVVTESEIQHFLMLALGIGGIGAGTAAVKRVRPRPETNAVKPHADTFRPPAETNTVKPQADTFRPPAETNTVRPSGMSVPRLGPEVGPSSDWLQTNLKQSEEGAMLPHGEPYLHLRVVGAKTFVSGVLSTIKGKALLVAQSDPDNVEFIKFRMALSDKTAMPKGEYELRFKCDRGTSYDMGGTLSFWIM